MKKCVNGQYIELTEEEIAQMQADEISFKQTEEYKQGRIAELEQMLSDTDYIACKIAEGSAVKEEYTDKIAQRREWRQEINELIGGE